MNRKCLSISALAMLGTMLAAFSATAAADTLGYVWASPIFGGEGVFVEIVLETGEASLLDVIEGLDLDGGCALPDGRIVAIDGFNREFWELLPDPHLVGEPLMAAVDAGMYYDVSSKTLYAISGGTFPDPTSTYLYRINPNTGASTFIGFDSRFYANSLAINPDGQAIAIDSVFTETVFNIDLATGRLTPIGTLSPPRNFIRGIAFAPDGTLWGVSSANGNPIFTIDTETWELTQVSRVPVGRRFQFLAIPLGPSECDPCDMNCDGGIDALDIEPFLDLLFSGGVPCNSCTGDTNNDGSIDALDIEPFLNCLFP